jgi:hypothetical protein
MAKPASGTGLDTGHALYTNLFAVYGFLEGSGTTTADSKGSLTGTLSSSGLWSTDADGPIVLTTSASTLNITTGTGSFGPSGHDWSMAFRVKQTTSNDNGLLLYDAVGTEVQLRGGTGILVQDQDGFSHAFTGQTDFTSQHDYVITFVASTGSCKVYVDGSLTSDGAQTIHANGRYAYTEFAAGANVSFVGSVSLIYFWKDRILTSTEAGTLHSTPYVIFQSGAAAFLAAQGLNVRQGINRAGTY